MLRGLRRLIPAPMLLLASALLAGAVLACGDDDDDDAATTTTTGTTDAPAAAEPLKVVTSTGILAHFAEQVAGDDAEVVAVIPAGADTHTFSASTGDIRNIAAADVVIVNGFNLEEGTLSTIFEHIPDDARLVIAAAGIKPLEGGHHDEEDDHGDEEEGEDHDEDEEEDHADEDEDEGDDHGDEEEEGDHHDEDEEEEGDDHGDEDEGEGHDEDEGDDHADEDDHGDEDHEKAEAPAGAELAVADGDPHMWLTVPNAMVYVRNIADGLAAADPDNAAAYRQRADAYLAELEALDAEVRAAVETIPQERRVLIVYHDSFQYFAAEYDLELAAAVLPASPSQQASAAAVAEIIEIVAGRDVGAVFREPQFAADALEAIAEEAGVGVSVLYSGAFTDEVNTYVDLMRFNARSLVEGLGGG